MKRYLVGAAIGVATVALITIGVALGGFVDVSATSGHSAPVSWLMHNTFEASVGRRAADIVPPKDLDVARRIEEGASSFESMCSVCHTPSGEAPSPVAKGLTPAPPPLAHLGDHMAPNEVFWVIDHGVKMTGMPAFGPTHGDEEIWALVAYVRSHRSATADGGDAHEH